MNKYIFSKVHTGNSVEIRVKMDKTGVKEAISKDVAVMQVSDTEGLSSGEKLRWR